MITQPTLNQALQAIGNAQVFIGDPFATNGGGMTSMGAKEGEVSFEIEEQFSDLTAPELTGPAIHQSTLMGVNASGTIPVIAGDPTLYTKLSSTGTASAGWSGPQAVITTSLLIIPNQEVGGGLTYSGTGWTRTAGNGVAAATGEDAAPKHAVWLWRVRLGRPSRSYNYENGGKQILSVPVQALFDGARPEGHKLFTQGDPVAAGITTLRI